MVESSAGPQSGFDSNAGSTSGHASESEQQSL